MQLSIREKRKLFFSNKIVTPEVIRNLATMFHDEAASALAYTSTLLNFSIDAADNSSYESASPDIFSEGQLIGKKTITRITMRFQTFENDKNMELQLFHTQDTDSMENYVVVSGDNSTWVNGMMTRLNENLETCQKQPAVERIMSYTGLPVVVIFIIFYFRLFYHDINNSKNDWLKFIGIIGIPLAIIFLLQQLGKYILTIWPSVELQTAPGYQQKPLQKRRQFKFIITMVVLPIIMAFVCDLLKNWMHLL